MNGMKKLNLFIIACLAVLMMACSHPAENKDDAPINTDRIVCVSKQLNEIIFALGAGSHVVGTDLTSIYPDEVKKLPKVGYHRLLSAEGIISLSPTVVIHDGNIAPAAVMPQVEKAGIRVKEFPEAKSIDETKALIRQLGKLFNRQKQADSLCNKLDADIAKASEQQKQYTTHPKVIIVHYGQQSNQYLVVGKLSVASQMLKMAGGENAVDIEKGMGPLSAEVVAKAQPDIILATDVGYDRLGVDKLKELPGIAETPAARNNKIYRIDERDIIYFTPRTGETVMKIMEMIHH